MTLRMMIAAIALVALAAPAFAQPATASALATAASSAKVFPVDPQYRTTLHDPSGAAISRAAFDVALRHGQRYVSHADAKTREITLTLLPPGVSTPDSFAPTDLKNLTFTMIMVDGRHYSVEFHDQQGQRIDQHAFAANARRGQRYTQVLDAKTGSAILTLLPMGANPSGSLLTAKWLAAATTAHATKHAAG